ncbi:MAG: hypothetical protein ACYC1C_21085 [Chloroflexota bacterium]
MQQFEPMHPLHLIVWAGVEEIIKDARLAGLIALGRAVANALPGETTEEKLEQFEGGKANREVIRRDGVDGKIVRLRKDLFSADCCGLPWSRHTEALLDRYNREVPRGGAALHPLHIVLHEVHRGLGPVYDIATRDPISGSLAFSHYGLQRAGLSEEQASQLLSDAAILYCICD